MNPFDWANLAAVTDRAATDADIETLIAAAHAAEPPDPPPPAPFSEPEDRGTATLSALGEVEYVEDPLRPGRIVVWAAEEGSGKSYTVDSELGIRVACAGGMFAGTWRVLQTDRALHERDARRRRPRSRDHGPGVTGTERSALAGCDTGYWAHDRGRWPSGAHRARVANLCHRMATRPSGAAPHRRHRHRGDAGRPVGPGDTGGPAPWWAASLEHPDSRLIPVVHAGRSCRPRRAVPSDASASGQPGCRGQENDAASLTASSPSAARFHTSAGSSRRSAADCWVDPIEATTGGTKILATRPGSGRGE